MTPNNQAKKGGSKTRKFRRDLSQDSSKPSRNDPSLGLDATASEDPH